MLGDLLFIFSGLTLQQKSLADIHHVIKQTFQYEARFVFSLSDVAILPFETQCK